MNPKRNGSKLIRVGLASVATLAAAALLLTWNMKTQAQSGTQGHTPVHMTTDWSNRHMVYSAPATTADAWKLQAEPRYLHQWTRRNLAPPPAQNAR